MEKRRVLLWTTGLLLTLVPALRIHSQNQPPLKLVQTIPMPKVQGRLDHLGVDVERKRLFSAALGDNQNTVEVIDLETGKRVFSIRGQSMPQGVFFSPDFRRLFVANGTDGTCKIFNGDTFDLVDSLPIGTDANHVGYDPATKLLYIGFGDAKSGGLAMIDTRNNRHIGDIKTDARSGGIKIKKSGSRIFVTLTGAAKLGVVDAKKRQEIATWPISGADGSVALALDEPHHRLFAGSRNPPKLFVFDTESGKQITQLEGVDGIDDLWYDAARRRIYASGGRGFEVGFAYVYRQRDADHYELIGKVSTSPGAGTSIWVAQFDRYYVAAPAHDQEDAAILVFEPQP